MSDQPSVASYVPTNPRAFQSSANDNGAYIPWRIANQQRTNCHQPCGGCARKNCSSCIRGDSNTVEQSRQLNIGNGSLYGAASSLINAELEAQNLIFDTPSSAQQAVRDRVSSGLTQIDAENQTLTDIFLISTAQLQERKLLSEALPGGTVALASGEIPNAIVGNISVPARFGENGDFFGDPFMTISTRRMAELNGWGASTVTNFDFTNNPGTLGSNNNPFQDSVFIIDLVNGNMSQWAARINQSAANFDTETQGNSLAVNGCASRTIFLLRRPQPYYFVFRRQTENPLFIGNACNLDINNNGFYITTDPIGGGPLNTINGYDGTVIPPTPGVQPPIFNPTRLLYPNGQGCAFVVTNDWPTDGLFYQSLSGPCMGGRIFVFGNYCTEI